MNINIIAVGKIKERFIDEGLKEFTKRLKTFININIIEIQDEKAPENLSQKQVEQVKFKEGERIIRQFRPGQVVIALDIAGMIMSSEDLAEKVAQWGLQGKSELSFVIGGSLGLSKQVLELADLRLSFGKMTFPHQLMRLILIEQVYRAIMINRGSPYHK